MRTLTIIYLSLLVAAAVQCWRILNGRSDGRAIIPGLLFVVGALAGVLFYKDAHFHFEKMQMQQAFDKDPALRGLQQYEPELWRQAFAAVEGNLKKNSPNLFDAVFQILSPPPSRLQEGQILQTVQPFFLRALEKNIGVSSNAAVIGYMQVMMEELNFLYLRGGEACYAFLFPPQGTTTPLMMTVNFPQELLNKDRSALIALMAAAHGAQKQALPGKDETEARMLRVMRPFAIKVGPRFEVIQKAQAPDVNKREVCAMTHELYQHILGYPQEEAGPLLRAMMAGGGK